MTKRNHSTTNCCPPIAGYSVKGIPWWRRISLISVLFSRNARQYQEAERYHRQALDIMQSFYGKEHYKTAHSLTLVARALEYQGRYAEATDMLQRALLINQKVFGPVHPSVASSLNELGNIAVRQGRYGEAATDFTRMVEIYRSCYHGKHYLIGIALANLGGVFMARKDNVRAEQLFHQALNMYAQTLPPNNLNEGITRTRLGRALLRQNRVAEAYSQTLAGYRIVSQLQSPTATYVQNASRTLPKSSGCLAISAALAFFPAGYLRRPRKKFLSGHDSFRSRLYAWLLQIPDCARRRTTVMRPTQKSLILIATALFFICLFPSAAAAQSVSVSCSPCSGPAGTVVQVTLSGWPSGLPVQVVAASDSGGGGSESGPSGCPGTNTNCTAPVTMPASSLQTTYYFVAQQDGFIVTASTTFTVIPPSFTMSPTCGPARDFGNDHWSKFRCQQCHRHLLRRHLYLSGFGHDGCEW